jgi:hypothetical protein
MRDTAMNLLFLLSFLLTVISITPGMAFDPNNPAGSGYILTFSDNFTNRNTIDLNYTNKPGFNWYPTLFPAFGSGKTANFTVGSSCDSANVCLPALTISPTIYTANYNLATATGGPAPSYYVGTTFSGGAYYAVKLKFNPAAVWSSSGRNVGCPNGGACWPSAWLLAREHLTYPNIGDQVPGDPAMTEHFVEDDMFEFDISWASKVAWGTGVHDWGSIGTGTCNYGYRTGFGGYCDITNSDATSGSPYWNFVSTLPGAQNIDWTQWHTIGQLWVPGTAANSYQGYVQNFIGGPESGGMMIPLSEVQWTDPSSPIRNLASLQLTPPYPVQPPAPYAFSITDQQHMVMILGSGPKEPMQVASVEVWQNSNGGSNTTIWMDPANGIGLNSGNNGISERSLIGTGFANGVALTAGNNGGAKQIRVTFEAAIAAGNWQVDHAAIGIWAGTGANTTNTPVELTFSGAHGFNIAQGATITSDWVTVPPFTTSNVLVVITDQNASNGTAGYTEFNLANSSNNYATGASYNQAVVSGYTAYNDVEGILSVEVSP